MWEIFEDLCRRNAVSVADVARETKIAQSTLSNWKKRRNVLNSKALRKIADYFGVSVQYLMTGEQSVEEIDSVLSGATQADYLVNDNDDIVFIVNSIRKWTPLQQKRLRKQVEWVNSIIGEE